jgi:hypothetical protein
LEAKAPEQAKKEYLEEAKKHRGVIILDRRAQKSNQP